QAQRHAVHRRHRRSGETRVGASQRRRSRLHSQIRLQAARLVCGLRRSAAGTLARATDEEMEAAVEAQRDRADECRVAGPLPGARRRLLTEAGCAATVRTW